jgi:general transcription factor 3C polypeptide 3 (transcription factor C subunit 4)
MRIRAYDKITDNCKRLSQMHQFRAEPLLLMLGALGGGGLKAHKAWVTLALQKFMQRELRIYDDATKGRTMHYSTKMGRWALPIQVGVSRWAFRTGKDEAAPPEEDDEEGEDEDDRVAAGGAEASTTRGASSRRRGEVGDEDEDDEDEDYEAERAEGDAELDVPKPTKPSPNFNTIYGQAMLSNKSYQTSLCECGSPHVSTCPCPPQPKSPPRPP